jgi:predicted  nucleic acid-binding Zn-ribbon protein
MNMAHQLRNYLTCGIISAGLMTSCIRATGTEVVLLSAGAAVGVMGLYQYFSKASIEARLTVVEGGLKKVEEGVKEVQGSVQKVQGTVEGVKGDIAAFKTETKANFGGVFKRQDALQQQLKDTAMLIDAQVSAARREIDGVRDIVLKTQVDVTDIKEHSIKIKQELKDIQDRLKRHTDQLASIQSMMAKESDTKEIELSIARMNGDIVKLAKMILTQGDMGAIKIIVREAVDEAWDARVDKYTTGHMRLSDTPYESTKPVPALPAPRAMLKQTA